MRAVGIDAENDQCAGLGSSYAALDGPQESAGIPNHVIGGGKQHERICALLRRPKRRDRGRRPRIAAHGLKHYALGGKADRFQLLGDEETMPAIGENAKIAEQRARKPPAGFLEQRLLAGEPVKLFRKGLARQGPKPRPRPPA